MFKKIKNKIESDFFISSEKSMSTTKLETTSLDEKLNVSTNSLVESKKLGENVSTTSLADDKNLTIEERMKIDEQKIKDYLMGKKTMQF